MIYQRDYIVVFKCIKCYKPLTNDEAMYSHGVCPFCGHVSDGTVCDTVKSSAKVTYKKYRVFSWFPWLTYTVGTYE